jgi:manganese efflux pump family protein
LTFLEILLISVGLAMDAFAVSLGAGTAGHASSPRPIFRLAFHFGLFQFMMPVIGWFLGTTVAPLIESADHWIAFGLLGFVGVRMIQSGLSSHDESIKTDPTKGMTLIMLSIATSIDALAIGLSLAFLQITIWYPSIVIGIVCAAFSVVGTRLGSLLGEKFGKRMEIFGGVILVLIGLRIVSTHLLP